MRTESVCGLLGSSVNVNKHTCRLEQTHTYKKAIKTSANNFENLKEILEKF